MDTTCARDCAATSACSRASRSDRSILPLPASGRRGGPRGPARSPRRQEPSRPAASRPQARSQARGRLSGPASPLGGRRRPGRATGTRGRRVYELTARGRRAVPPPARDRGAQTGRGPWLCAALGLRPLSEPGRPALCFSSAGAPSCWTPGKARAGRSRRPGGRSTDTSGRSSTTPMRRPSTT